LIVLKIIGYFMLGLMGVGLPTIRTLKVIDGHYIQVFFIALLSTINLYIFTLLVITKDITFMIPNALGASVAVSYLAYRRKK